MPIRRDFEFFGLGSYGYLPNIGLHNKSMFVNIKDDTGNCMLYSVLCSLYAIEMAKQQSVDLYNCVEFPNEKMLNYLEDPATWKLMLNERNVVQPELLLNWNQNVQPEQLVLWNEKKFQSLKNWITCAFLSVRVWPMNLNFQWFVYQMKTFQWITQKLTCF